MKNYNTNFILFLLIGCALSFCSMTQQLRHAAAPSNNSGTIQNIIMIDGNCYLKYPIMDQEVDEQLRLPIYNGSLDQLDERFIERRLIEIKAEKKGWFKTEQPGQKELVWCLIDEPGEYLELLIVRDTTQIKSFEYHTAQLSKKEADGIYYQMEQIVCKEDQDDALFVDVCQALQKSEYTKKCKKKGLTNKLKKSIAKYQKDHNLPIGQLNYKTLEHLGIKMK